MWLYVIIYTLYNNIHVTKGVSPVVENNCKAWVHQHRPPEGRAGWTHCDITKVKPSILCEATRNSSRKVELRQKVCVKTEVAPTMHSRLQLLLCCPLLRTWSRLDAGMSMKRDYLGQRWESAKKSKAAVSIKLKYKAGIRRTSQENNKVDREREPCVYKHNHTGLTQLQTDAKPTLEYQVCLSSSPDKADIHHKHAKFSPFY